MKRGTPGRALLDVAEAVGRTSINMTKESVLMSCGGFWCEAESQSLLRLVTPRATETFFMILWQEYKLCELCKEAEGSIFTSQKCRQLEGGRTRRKSRPGEQRRA